MMDNEIHKQLSHACYSLDIGSPLHPPKEIAGGLLHKLFYVQTNGGTYAIKYLNPSIMQRQQALSNFIYSERISSILSQFIPASVALTFNGTQVHNIAGHYYLLFDWIDGESVQKHQTKLYHCEKIAHILATIHSIDESNYFSLAIEKNVYKPQVINWHYLVDKGMKQHISWANIMDDNIHNLYKWSELSNEALKKLYNNQVISHRDLEPKNVIWTDLEPIIIDWESAGYINPLQDVIETAIYWSKSEQGIIDKEKFITFLSTYHNVKPLPKPDWPIILQSGFSSMLGWLEYSIKRSLWIECADENEQRNGEEQTLLTLNAILRFESEVEEISEWLHEWQMES